MGAPFAKHAADPRPMWLISYTCPMARVLLPRHHFHSVTFVLPVHHAKGLAATVRSLLKSVVEVAQAGPSPEHVALAQQLSASTPSTSQMGAMEEGKLAHRARQEERCVEEGKQGVLRRARRQVCGLGQAGHRPSQEEGCVKEDERRGMLGRASWTTHRARLEEQYVDRKCTAGALIDACMHRRACLCWQVDMAIKECAVCMHVYIVDKDRHLLIALCSKQRCIEDVHTALSHEGYMQAGTSVGEEREVMGALQGLSLGCVDYWAHLSVSYICLYSLLDREGKASRK
eukprot:scaffold189230_cov23-Tisochrysis_lutea.AAC.1